MADKCCFVQFPHPEGEHRPNGNCRIGWNKLPRSHGRKFMQLRGEWIDGDGGPHKGDL